MVAIPEILGLGLRGSQGVSGGFFLGFMSLGGSRSPLNLMYEHKAEK